jgi:hypothetical protein
MPVVWTFGDSYTDGFRSSERWAKEYVQWKGYQPKTFGEIISHILGFHLENLGKGGSSNYQIFEIFCKVADRIEKNDLVIFGWSSPIRFRLVNKFDEWTSILPNFKNQSNVFNNISQETFTEILINRESKLYSTEVNHWINLIHLVLKNTIIIHWTPFSSCINAELFESIETIYNETKGEIDDRHLNEKGHKKLSEHILSNYWNIKNKNLL